MDSFLRKLYDNKLLYCQIKDDSNKNISLANDNGIFELHNGSFSNYTNLITITRELWGQGTDPIQEKKIYKLYINNNDLGKINELIRNIKENDSIERTKENDRLKEQETIRNFHYMQEEKKRNEEEKKVISQGSILSYKCPHCFNNIKISITKNDNTSSIINNKYLKYKQKYLALKNK
jgi:hypothetical protein